MRALIVFALMITSAPLAMVSCGGEDSAAANAAAAADAAAADGGPGGPNGNGMSSVDGGSVPLPPAPACKAGTAGSATVAKPELLIRLKDRDNEGWLASPAVADLDGDGKSEIIAARDGVVVAWHADGTVVWRFVTQESRIWSSPVVGDFRGDKKLEIAVAAKDKVWLLDAAGAVLSGFPVTWTSELRSLAGGDVDGDGQLDLIAAPGKSGPTDVMNAWHADGTTVAGFPPNQAGTSGCAVDKKCYIAGCYDQNVAVGDLDGDGKQDIVAPHDNAYASIHKGTGVSFDAPAGYSAKKTPGVRYLHALAEAKKGFAEEEETALQAHFTNTAPAIADLDGDGKPEVILLGSVQNASQSKREQGVGLWALHPDASRLAGWETPLHIPAYLAGLWDYEDTNIVAATNQVSVADIDPTKPGPEMIFAGFDGRIHAVAANRTELWSVGYTTDANVLTGGVVIGDLSGDGIPEVVFASYSKDQGKGNLFILDAGGKELHRIALPRRGAMPVPTLADVDGNGTVDIVVSLKDAEDKVESVLVYAVPKSQTNCLPWPTGRGNLYRNGWVRKD